MSVGLKSLRSQSTEGLPHCSGPKVRRHVMGKVSMEGVLVGVRKQTRAGSTGKMYPQGSHAHLLTVPIAVMD